MTYEWRAEPNEVDFIDPGTGYPCVMRRGRMKDWCGYVGISVKHPWFGMNYSDVVKAPLKLLDRSVSTEEVGFTNVFCQALNINSLSDSEQGKYPLVFLLRCHGGLTYSAPSWWNKKDESHWWFGFDCGHCDDLIPYFIDNENPEINCGHLFKDAIYRNVEYVRGSLLKLCMDLKIAEEDGRD